MPKYDLQKYKISPPKEFDSEIEGYITPKKKIDLSKYKIPTPEEFKTSEPEGDNDASIIGKSVLKGLGSIADLPKAAASGLEAIAVSKAKRNAGGLYAPDFQGDDVDVQDIDFISSRIPSTDDARSYLKEKTGIDLEPHPTNATQRMISHGGEFAGSMIGTGGLGSILKAGKAGLSAYKPAQIAKDTLTGASIGLGSGGLQEAGINPLVADIGVSILHPTSIAAIKAPYNLGRKFTVKGRAEAVEREVSDMLKKRVGKDNINAVAERLSGVSPLNTELLTAELAENAGLAGIHRAYSPNIPAIAEKNKRNNDAIRYALEELGDTTPPPYVAGDFVRNPLIAKLEKYKKTRAAKTEPLYDELENIQEVVDLPSTKAFLDKKYVNATKTRKGTIDGIRKDIINEEGQKLFEEFQRDYGHLSSDARVQAYNQLKLDLLPKPAKASNVIQELGDRIKANYKKPRLSRFLTKTRENIISDLEAAGVPQEKIAREAYSKYSKPVNTIEENPLLSKIVKKDLTSGELKLPPEKIFGTILGGSINDIKTLVKQIRGNTKALDTLRGQITNELLRRSGTTHAEGNLSYPTFRKLIKTHEEKLKLIYTPEQLKTLTEAEEILRKRNFVDTFGRAKGSNTQSETTLLNSIFKAGGNKFLREGTAYALPGGGFMYDVAKNAFYDAKKAARDELITGALLDPTTARNLLLRQDGVPSYVSLARSYYKPLQSSAMLEALRHKKDS